MYTKNHFFLFGQLGNELYEGLILFLSSSIKIMFCVDISSIFSVADLFSYRSKTHLVMLGFTLA